MSGKYWAFISYSHQDEAWATWLHRALETYRVPRRLAGRTTDAGVIPQRLFPIFRDRDELPSSHELGAVINRALADSRNLIVVCSPRSATSKWVNEEIKAFRALGRSHRIFCLIVDGEPHAAANPGHAFSECFAPALRGDADFEPIAADARPRKDGKDGAKLKLIAGLLGLGLDELKQREKQRRFWQRVQQVAAAIVIAGVLGGSWQWFLSQRAAREKEILVERLVENGRLELLDGREARAAVYLNEALKLGQDTVPVRFMLGQAMRAVDAQDGVRVRHGGGHVRRAAFSPDGKRFILIVDLGEKVVGKVYDATTGAEQAVLEGVPAYPRIVQFLPDGERVLVSGFNQSDAVSRVEAAPATGVWTLGRAEPVLALTGGPGRIGTPLDRERERLVVVDPAGGLEIWAVASGQKLQAIATERLFAAATYSADGSLLAAADSAGNVDLWSADGFSRVGALPGFEGQAVVGIQFTPDGRRVLAFSQFGDVRVWDVQQRKQVLAFAADPAWIGGLVFSADGRRFLTIGGEGYKVWSAARGVLLLSRELSEAWYATAALSPDGNFLYTADTASAVSEIWAVRSRSRLHSLDLHTAGVTAVAVDAGGERLLLASMDGTAEIWSTAINPVAGKELQGEVPYSVRFDPATPNLLIAGGNFQRGRAMLVTPAFSIGRTFEGHDTVVRATALDPSGSRLITGAYDGSSALWNLRTGERINLLPHQRGAVHRAEFSPDGARAAVASYSDQIGTYAAGLLFAGDTGAPIAELVHERPIYRLSFSPDGSRLATASEDGTIKLWSAKDGAMLRTLKGHTGAVLAASFDPAGRRLVSTGQDNSIRLWDVEAGNSLGALVDPAVGTGLHAIFAPDGAAVAVGTREGHVLLWEPGTGRLRALKGHQADVVEVHFLHEGRILLSHSWDGTVRAWDPVAGMELARVAAPGGVLNAMDVSADSTRLAVASSTYYAGVWSIAPEARSSDEIAAILRCRSIWMLADGQLAPRQAAAEDCPVAGP